MDPSYSWRQVAPHRDPLRLCEIALASVAALVTTTTGKCQNKDELKYVCELLRTSLPMDVRTAVMREVVSSQKNENKHQLKSLLSTHLLTDVNHIGITTEAKSKQQVHFDHEDCLEVLEVLEGVESFHLESLHLEGVEMEEGFLTRILDRCPRLQSIHVSGDLCSEVLTHLQENPCDLRSLQLDSCTVSDEDVVRALVGANTDFCALGNIICSGGDATELEPAALQSLRHLSVESSRLSVCGALVLLCFLRNLRQIQYTAWNSPISDILLFLQQVTTNPGTFSLSSLAQWRPTEETLKNLVTLCPRLQSLMIECYDPSLTSFEVLSEFQELKALTLRLVSEELIVSAVKALGKNLLELDLEFEEYTYHSISMETIKAIQAHCPHLQRLEMKHVNISSNQGDHLPPKNAIAFPELKRFTLSSAVIQPVLLERLIAHNKSLETLTLDVNQDALTDTVMEKLLKNNSLHKLSLIYLGAGSLSAQSITSLLVLPSLAKLSLDLKRFPFIPVSTFTTLEETLAKGNYQCGLENITKDD
ncbi:uncharacterized protein LOC122256483 [Penaeus japonicus]|uniref:uncharacterized protein LOC122256483 n=1 Tax=Penaeus japonicus TaxID=27405 RepID=UPI001C70D400|nr:uncharacterized protein LOC122256483 [Penaeus japonicus]